MTQHTSSIQDFKACFGVAFDCTDTARTERAQSTYGYHSSLLGVLYPESRQSIVQAIKLAEQHKLQLSPISRGKNWGWGSSAPHQPQTILLDLSRMRGILDFSEQLGYITIQAGVSVAEVIAFLERQGSQRMLPMGGTTADASLIGHLCERGIAVGTSYHDRASHVCGLQAILGDGRVIHTGMRRYGQSAVAATHRWGPGASLESLLTQSDFAIVTEATIWLPTKGENAFAVIAASHQLADLVDTFRDCEGLGLRVAAQIYNRAKVEKLFFARNPAMRQQLPPGDWVAIAPVYPASAQHAEADRTLILQRLQQHEDCKAVTLPLDASFGPFNGQAYANDDVLLGMLYRWGEHQRGPEVDPQRDQCGILWGCFAAPMLGDAVTQACTLITKILAAHDLEVFQAVHSVSERACLLFPQLSFPQARRGEAVKAMQELTDSLHNLGFPVYRVPAGLGGVAPSGDDHDAVVQQIRQVFNPHHVLAQGKYTPSVKPATSASLEAVTDPVHAFN